MPALKALFWASFGALAWTHVAYPAAAGALARARSRAVRREPIEPTVTVIVAAHDEEAVIERRVANLVALDYPKEKLELVVTSDASADRTEALAEAAGARVVRNARAGKVAAQNRAVRETESELVAFSDANATWAPDALRKLVRGFADPEVAYVCGQLKLQGDDGRNKEGLYWRYERRVRDLESRAGFLTAVTGALLAVRRSAYRPVSPSVSADHVLPLFVREAGGLVVYRPNAEASDRPISGLREQFSNRSRTATRGIHANLSMVVGLAPWRRPRTAIAMWSRKLLRWATPWFIAVATIAATALVASGSTA